MQQKSIMRNQKYFTLSWLNDFKKLKSELTVLRKCFMQTVIYLNRLLKY
mgnify:CR=1 FL=1